MVVAMAREAAGLGLVAQGIATPLVTAALLLARRCFDHELRFVYAIGNSYGDAGGSYSLLDPEAMTLGRALWRFDFLGGAGELLPRVNPAEFFRPAQVDATGATNNVRIGPADSPKLRLPGAAGIPDVSPGSRTARLYVPRHSPRVFVERLDFVSGAGAGALGVHGPAPGPVRVFTDLAVLRPYDGRLGVERLMPGVSAEQVQEATGFELAAGPAPEPVEAPAREVLEVLREEVDPLGLRELDFLPARDRLARLWELCEA
jgi:glutaconate CoA-transferase subunit A